MLVQFIYTLIITFTMVANHVVNYIIGIIFIFVLCCAGGCLFTFHIREDEESANGRCSYKCLPVIAFTMVIVSALPIFCAIFMGLDTIFVGAAGEVFALIFSCSFCCVWCCTFCVSSTEVDRKFYEGVDPNDPE